MKNADWFIQRMREWRHKGKALPDWTQEDFESYLHEVIRPGVVLTEEMVFIVGAYTSVRHASDKPPQRELRNDARGRLDDVVIEDVKLFRLERMDKDRWWMRLYMPDGDDYVFDITTSGREIRIYAEIEREDDANPTRGDT